MAYQLLPESTAPPTPDTTPIFPIIFTAVCVVPALVIGVSSFWHRSETSAHTLFMTGLRFFAIGFAYMVIGVFSVPILGLHYVDKKHVEDVEVEAEAEVEGDGGLDVENSVAMDGGNVTAAGWERRDSVEELEMGNVQRDDAGYMKAEKGIGEKEEW
ncbi:uncharacterized protein F4807DRAFT_464498 [Annulohypoxylon truncatum]|uniref:uncharacterized protein n=1 Tax=Annulohypoxylon truncatum TaxID=327061 RepID=UPI00200742E7|nr:uncharacterized protein F4807DRAFT_464498 [Annulohypoxylon truncatum]KAI1205615.1 hypothetical protein F4807DRAFT_464498 [Annulohypoxylon truncatum]